MNDRMHNHFDEAERETLKEGVAAWKQIKRQDTWEAWLLVGKAIATVQDIAERVTGQTSGRTYTAFLTQAYEMPSYLGDFADMSKQVRSSAALCWRNREAIALRRAALGSDQALRMTHPHVVWLDFQKSRKPERTPAQEEGEKPLSPLAKTQQALAKAIAENDALKKERDGEVSLSLRDGDDDIATVLISHFGDARVERIVTVVRRKLGKKEPKR